jgi:hypothetical protein
MTMPVPRLSGLSVTLYCSEKGKGQSCLASLLRLAWLRPKSSLTELSALPVDSEVDDPRNSQVEVRAKPCWGSLEVSGCSGAVPKTCSHSRDG